MNKICSKCGKKKFYSEFYNHKLTKDGLRPDCKECGKNYQLTHRIEIAKLDRNRRKTIIGYLRSRFSNMKQRCSNPKATGYKHYGGRGIKCKFKSINEFINYIINELQIDPRGLEIDRIDNNGNYEPGNIRLVTHRENCNNK